MEIILASGSPRRKELLQMLGVGEFKVIPAKGDEVVPDNAGPGEIVEALSGAKAAEVAARVGEDALVIAADTIVWFEDRVYGKPHSEEEAFAMLSALSGNNHEVYTGITMMQGGKTIRAHERTVVCFRDVSPEEIRGYIATGEPMDKAGAYGAQGIGALLIRGIEGDFFNVMGLPICRLGNMLSSLGVNLL